MLRYLLILLTLFSAAIMAANNEGTVCFGQNYAKPFDEHTDRLYLKINDSEKLYFNDLLEKPVQKNLDINRNHLVKVYFDNQIASTWILNFAKLNTQSVVIWRAAGSWRMDPVDRSICR